MHWHRFVCFVFWSSVTSETRVICSENEACSVLVLCVRHVYARDVLWRGVVSVDATSPQCSRLHHGVEGGLCVCGGGGGRYGRYGGGGGHGAWGVGGHSITSPAVWYVISQNLLIFVLGFAGGGGGGGVGVIV